MQGISAFLIFTLSLIGLYYGAKLLTGGAEHFAKVMGISEFVIGATIVALGTSLPELASSAFAVAAGYPEIVVGNVLGSNLANIGLALGISAVLYPIIVHRKITEIEIPFLIASSVAFAAAFLDLRVVWIEGLMLLIMYAAYIHHETSVHLRERGARTEKFQPRYILLLLAGMILLYFGAEYLVASVLDISEYLGVSDVIVAFILVAIGTSLPEIATSLIAARQGMGDIAVGNVLGSCTVNSLVVTGAASLMGELSVDVSFLVTSLSVMIGLSLMIGFMAFNNRVSRFEGTLLFLIYCLAAFNIV